jgi:2-methylcitrate dehydratase PrpD
MMARSIQPTHKLRGYHATGTCGLLGIAMASAIALDFCSVKLKNAFSTAAVSATGTLKVLEDSSELKPYNVAKTALLGLIAIQMAIAGFDTPNDPLSGFNGFLGQMYGSDEVEFVPPLLNGTYAMEKAYIKPYAACRYTHPSIDIAKDLRKKRLLQTNQISEVVIKTYSLAVKNHDHTDIKGAASGKMSIPYNFAVAYLSGETGLNAFTPEYLDNVEIKELTRKIIVLENDEMTAAFPEKTYATVEMTCADGEILKGISELPKGEPENPLSLTEVIEKFLGLAQYGGKTKEEASKIVEAVFDIENDIKPLQALLRQ